MVAAAQGSGIFRRRLATCETRDGTRSVDCRTSRSSFGSEGRAGKRAARPPEVRGSHRDPPRLAPRPTRAPTPLTLDLFTREKKKTREKLFRTVSWARPTRRLRIGVIGDNTFWILRGNSQRTSRTFIRLSRNSTRFAPGGILSARLRRRSAAAARTHQGRRARGSSPGSAHPPAPDARSPPPRTLPPAPARTHTHTSL